MIFGSAMDSRKIFFAFFIVFPILLFPTSLFAQEKAAAATGGKSGESYSYEFGDDPLSAGGFGPNDATIRVRQATLRQMLIRPRVSFVPEMLKSVENL